MEPKGLFRSIKMISMLKSHRPDLKKNVGTGPLDQKVKLIPQKYFYLGIRPTMVLVALAMFFFCKILKELSFQDTLHFSNYLYIFCSKI